MKIILLVIIAFLIMILTACGGGGGGSDQATETTTIKTEALACKPTYYGDSITGQFSKASNAPDFNYDFVGGRRITDLLMEGPATKPVQTVIDYTACHIYLALGTNSHWTLGLDELWFLQLIEGYRDKITCVLPMTKRGELIAFREVMIRECTNIIDPIQFGVLPLSGDGVHLMRDSPENAEHYASIFEPINY